MGDKEIGEWEWGRVIHLSDECRERRKKNRPLGTRERNHVCDWWRKGKIARATPGCFSVTHGLTLWSLFCQLASLPSLRPFTFTLIHLVAFPPTDQGTLTKSTTMSLAPSPPPPGTALASTGLSSPTEVKGALLSQIQSGDPIPKKTVTDDRSSPTTGKFNWRTSSECAGQDTIQD